MYAVHFYKQSLNRPKCTLCRGPGKQGYFSVGRDFSKLNGTPGNEHSNSKKRHLMLIL